MKHQRYGHRACSPFAAFSLAAARHKDLVATRKDVFGELKAHLLRVVLVEHEPPDRLLHVSPPQPFS